MTRCSRETTMWLYIRPWRWNNAEDFR